MPRKVFTAGEILTAADVNTNLMDQAVMVFDTSAARGSAIPSPSEGMVTYLKDTDKVEVFDGSSFGAFGGKILQVVQTVKTDVFSTASATFVDVTGLSVSITPSATSSKIYVIANTVLGNDQASTAGRFTVARLVRGATAIGSGTAGLAAGDGFASAANLGNSEYPTKAGIGFLDSPNTVSSTTYTVQLRQQGGGTAFVNRNANNNAGGSSDITVIEVAG